MNCTTPEEFQQLVWGNPVVPNLPKFERKILIKHGKNIAIKTKQHEQTIEREQAKLKRGYGKQPTKLINTTYNKVLDWRCFSRIRGVVTSFNVASTHKGHKLLEAVIIHMLGQYPILHHKLLEWDYGYSDKQARVYMKAFTYVLNSINHIELEDNDDIDKSILQKLL